MSRDLSRPSTSTLSRRLGPSPKIRYCIVLNLHKFDVHTFKRGTCHGTSENYLNYFKKSAIFFQTLLERAPFTILTNSPNPVAFFSSHIKMNARLAGFVYESTYLTDGNPAQVLCNRSGLEEVLARKNPLLHLRQTVELVIVCIVFLSIVFLKY